MTKKRDGLWFFFVSVFVVTWGVGALYALFPHQLVALAGPPSGTNPVFMIAVAAPTVMGIIAAALTAGRAGIRDIFSRLLIWRVGLQWYVLATFGLAALSLAPRLLASTLHISDLNLCLHGSAWLAIGVSAFWTDPGPLGEELGWRGFALPRLEQRMSGRSAALLLGVVWGVWHLPAFFIPGLPQNAFPPWAFMVTIVSLAVLVVWIVNNSGGSVIVAILAHWSANRFEALDPATAPYTAGFFAAAALVVMALAGPELGSRRMRPPPAVKPK